MLFQTENILESEKERNFYSKVFAGYYFNELIPGYEQRLEAFSNLLRNNKDLTFSGVLDNRFRLSPKSTHVTFDFHAYLLREENDRGELADVLITDLENASAVAIEVKFLKNWEFKKDIEVASSRILSLLESNRISSFVHVLLISRSKLNGARRAVGKQTSNWAKLSHVELPYPLVVLTWEDIAETCKGSDADLVTNFIHQHVKGSRKSFRTNARKLLELE